MKENSESGNVIFYILIAVVLLAALSFAVSQGGRSSLQSMTTDRTRLLAAELIEYGDILAKTVAQMRLRGTDPASLSFAHGDLPLDYGTYGTDPANEVFNLSGGGVTYKDPPTDALNTAGIQYEFLGGNEIELVGTTCAALACSDLIMTVTDVKQDICIKLNDLLSITNPAGVPPNDANMDTAHFAGTFSYTQTIGNEAGSVSLEGHTAGCFLNNTTSQDVYYQVLLPR